jgi:hypothetical protein
MRMAILIERVPPEVSLLDASFVTGGMKPKLRAVAAALAGASPGFRSAERSSELCGESKTRRHSGCRPHCDHHRASRGEWTDAAALRRRFVGRARHICCRGREGEVVGCGGLDVYSSDSAEVYGLATAPEGSPPGTGKAIIQGACRTCAQGQNYETIRVDAGPRLLQQVWLQDSDSLRPASKSLEGLRGLPEVRQLRRDRDGPGFELV